MKKKHKLSPPWEGPYTVIEVIRPGTYRLEDNNDNALTNTWNIEQLRRFFPKLGLTTFSFYYHIINNFVPKRKHIPCL